MKKTIAIIFFTALSAKQYAQIEKGTYLPSISISASYVGTPHKDSLSSTKNSTVSTTTGLGFGKFIKDNLLLTGSFSYGHSNNKYDYVDDKYSYRNDGNSSFENTENIAVSLLKYKFITENFAIRYGASVSALYSETTSRTYSYSYIYNSPTNTYIAGAIEKGSSYSNTLGATLNLLAGIQYFVSKNLALTGSMGFFSVNYSHSPYQKIKQVEAHSLNFSLTPSFNEFSVGLSYYIRPKAAK